MRRNKKEKNIPVIHIAMLGSSGVGKSALCSRFVNSQFEWVHETTSKVQKFRKLVDLAGQNERNQFCILEIDDVFPINHPTLMLKSEEGEKMNKKLDDILENGKIDKSKQRRGHFVYEIRQIHCYCFLYDISDKNTLDEIEQIMDYVMKREDKEAGRRESIRTNKVLIASKADRVDPTSSDVSDKNALDQQIQASVKKYGCQYYEVSALENLRIEDMFTEIARQVIDLNIVKEEDDEDEEEDEQNKRASSFAARLFNACGCGGRDKPDDEFEEEELEEDDENQDMEEESSEQTTTAKKKSKCVLF